MEGTTATAATSSTPAAQAEAPASTPQAKQTVKPTPAHQAQQKTQSVFEQQAAQVKESKAKPTEAVAADDWSEDNDKQLAELLSRKSKKDANFRFRHKGEEKTLDSLDDLKSMILDAQRGRGANKLVEEAKKEREAISQQKQQMEAIQQAFASGDPELAEAALQLLAGDKAYDLAQAVAERRKQQADEYAGLSDRERQLLERNKALESEFQRLQAEEAKQKQEQIHKQKEAQIKQISEQAKNNTRALLESMNLSEDAMLAYGPHVVSVMREAMELGQEVGRDIPFESVKQLAQQRAAMAVVEPIKQLSPKTFVDMFGPQFVVAVSKELASRQGRPVQQSIQQSQSAQRQQPKANEPQLGTYEYLKSLRGL